MKTPEQIEITRWLDASWCPDPYSKRQMGYPCDLIRQGDALVVIVRKRRKGKGVRVAELPPFICNMHDLEHYHDAGAYVDVVIDGSDRSRQRVKITLYLSGEELRKHADAVRLAKSEARDARKIQRDQKLEKVERRRERRRRVSGSMIGGIVRCSGAIARLTTTATRGAIRNARRGWIALVEWTNGRSTD